MIVIEKINYNFKYPRRQILRYHLSFKNKKITLLSKCKPTESIIKILHLHIKKRKNKNAQKCSQHRKHFLRYYDHSVCYKCIEKVLLRMQRERDI